MLYENENEFNTRYSPLTNRIIRILSEDSRKSVTDIAKALSIHRKEAERRLRAVENEFRLKYTLDLNQSRIGLNSPHIIGIKLGKRISIKTVMDELNRYYIPQLVCATRGKYDLLVYANAYSKSEYVSWDRAMRRILAREDELRWDTSEVTFRRFGFFPLTSRTIEHSKLSRRQKDMLKILNDNSRIPLIKMAKMLNMNYKTLVYSFNELLKAGYITRFTTIIPMRKEVTVIGVLIKYLSMREDANLNINSSRLFTSDSDNPLINRYLIKTSLLGAYDSFFMGAFDSMRKAMRYGVGAYKEVMRGIASDRIVVLNIREVLLGNLPIRSMDMKREYREHRSNPAYAVDM